MSAYNYIALNSRLTGSSDIPVIIRPLASFEMDCQGRNKMALDKQYHSVQYKNMSPSVVCVGRYVGIESAYSD